MRKRYRKKPPVSVGHTYEERCSHCRGTGQEPSLPDLTCRECIGRGRRRWQIMECKVCGGSGRQKVVFNCETCRGKGWVRLDVG